MKDFPISPGQSVKANFLERPNRFLVRCSRRGLGVIDAHLPNPGRLWELLLPGAEVYLYRAAASDRIHASQRKTTYSVLAVQRKGFPIFLDTGMTNQVARWLIERKLIPSLEGAEVVREEVSYGKSRFDFLLREAGKDLYLEVKSCTLFGNGVAMFPDAVTERGKRHLLELAEMGRNGIRSMILFIVHYPHVRWFMPDFHTDYNFSTTMLKVRDDLMILPIAVGWRPDLTIDQGVRILEIPWKYLKQEIKDIGSYLLVLRLERRRLIRVGGLGKVMFEKGSYIYVGSAMRNLRTRIGRHGQRRKKMHWHIDYLTQVADGFLSIPIRSSQRQECEITQALSSIMKSGPLGFGSSDCHCFTHLFWNEGNPLEMEAFHNVLERFRMRRP
ncbi:MAG: DNA/RNA nuclease SfsA [Desulfatiglandales bacterium]